MRALLQRVSRASVTAGDQQLAAGDQQSAVGGHRSTIGPGLLILLGVRRGDTVADATWLARKCAGLRIFEDDAGKMNRSLLEMGGEALVVSQFTLYGDADRGRRPSFILAAPPDEANRLYEEFVAALRAEGVRRVGTGVFQAMMQVELVNDGPVTVMVETRGPVSESGAPNSVQAEFPGPVSESGASNSVQAEFPGPVSESGTPNSVQAEFPGPVSESGTSNSVQAESTPGPLDEPARMALARHLLPADETLVLASASPRRTEILSRAGIRHLVVPVDVDESAPPDQAPATAAESIARRKALAAASGSAGRWILAADTIVDCAGRSFGKPVDDEDARAMLGQLSGCTHQVHTGLSLVTPGGAVHSGVESTHVTFRHLSPQEIDHYVRSGEPHGKAGAYAIQGIGALLIDRIDGSYDNVVGLPLNRLLALFREAMGA